MKNIAVRIMYDGSRYHGWQVQKNGITVQEIVENALSRLTGECVSICGCSRTDSGVHALEYVFNFKTDTKIPPEKLPCAINAQLRGEGIAATDAIVAEDDFSARFSSAGKRYSYKILNSKQPNPFVAGFSWHIPYDLDIESMTKAAAHFCGKHDFSAFMAAGGSQKTTVRTIRDCTVKKSSNVPELIEIEVEADAFLYNMVRIITGTLVSVGEGKIKPDDIPNIIESLDRRRAGMTAPPQGLFLKKVFYEPSLFSNSEVK